MLAEPELPLADIGPLTAARIGTRFDRISIEVRPDYGAPGKPTREMHIYRQNDGRELKCAGLHFCRECNKAEGLV